LKRTLLAMGLAVLVSLMVVPYGNPVMNGKLSYRAPFFLAHDHYRVQVDDFLLPTLFFVILAATLVNLFPYRLRKHRERD